MSYVASQPPKGEPQTGTDLGWDADELELEYKH